MDFWTAAVIIIAIIAGTELAKSRHKAKVQAKTIDNDSTSKIEELERRIESLETLIIDLEREKKFRDLQ